MQVQTGLDSLLNDKNWQQKIKGQVGYLCHTASINSKIQHGVPLLKTLFGSRLKSLFGPQHGFQTDVQDNMVETNHSVHPHFKMKVYSLYSETRIPTAEMLQDLDSVIIDLQDVGTRIYTYIYTLAYMLQECGKNNCKVFILDRPNPIGCQQIEGNILQEGWTSFVGLYPLPTRHAMTMGEIAHLYTKEFGIDCDYEVIPMQNYQRSMYFEDTGVPWAMPSPNMPTVEAAFPFVGTVLFEGTCISEGRGTTRPLEIVGHPGIEPFSYLEKLKETIPQELWQGVELRPMNFLPTFQKHKDQVCGGYQIHVTDRKTFKPFLFCHFLCREFYNHLEGKDFWKQPPYEYEYDRMPIDLINGTDEIRHWVEKRGSLSDLKKVEERDQQTFLGQRENSLIYK